VNAAAAIVSESSEARERQWVAAARDGDPEAFRSLVQTYQDRLFTFLLRMVRHHEEAEDLAQEAFVRAWRHLASYDPRWAFRTWLFSIARHLALNALRRPRATIISIDSGGDEGRSELALASPNGSPADQAAIREQKRRLARALEDLTPRAAMVFTLFYQEEMSIAEIAQTVGMSSGAVKVALHRVRETLKTRMRTA